MEGKFIAVDMEEQTVFILSGDSEYLKQQKDTLFSRGATLLHEQETINHTISMTCISKMSQLIKTLSEKNEELYIKQEVVVHIRE